MEFDPSSLAQSDRYKLLIGAIVPRPIAVVSTVSPDGEPNLAPFSFFAGVSSEPMSLLFCPSNKPDGSEKDTLRNLLSVAEGDALSGGEFVVSVASQSYIRRVVACAEELSHGDSEFHLSGLHPASSTRVRPPRIAGSPVAFECVVDRIIRLAPGRPGGGNIVIGRIVHIHAAAGVVDERFRVDPDRVGAVGRMAGLTYCSTSERFEIPWGAAALESGV